MDCKKGERSDQRDKLMSNIKAQSSNKVQIVNGQICDLEARGGKKRVFDI